ncbi:MAG: M42 family peptidase, partial [Clostridia bacterium]|nr:M42 family peptidase [Clostridia bacterium]
GIIHTSAGGVKTIAVSIPCRYLHSPSCVIKESDVEETQKIILAFSEDFAND